MFKVLYASCCFRSLYGILLYQFPMTNMKTFFARCPMKNIWRCLLKTKRQEFRVSHGILLMPTWMSWRRWVLLLFYFLRSQLWAIFVNALFFLNKKRGDSQSSLSEDQLCAVMLDLHFAGTDTTANTLLSGLLYLMKYPHIQGMQKFYFDVIQILSSTRMLTFLHWGLKVSAAGIVVFSDTTVNSCEVSHGGTSDLPIEKTKQKVKGLSIKEKQN